MIWKSSCRLSIRRRDGSKAWTLPNLEEQLRLSCEPLCRRAGQWFGRRVSVRQIYIMDGYRFCLIFIKQCDVVPALCKCFRNKISKNACRACYNDRFSHTMP